MCMPSSHNILKNDIRVYFSNHVDIGKRILDIGAGVGTYSKLLRDMGYRMDGMEVWLPYVVEYKLNELYDNVIIGNVMNYDISKYDVIILGDVLEHLSVEDGLELMGRIESNGQMCIVAVPYKLEQGVVDGNEYEVHKQSDLTHEIVLSRYNNLRLLFKSDLHQYGYYINRDGYYNNDMQCYVDSLDKVSNRLQIIKVNNNRIEYVNDGISELSVRVSVYVNGVNVYTCEQVMRYAIAHWSELQSTHVGVIKYIFEGDGIYKQYEISC